MMTKLGRPKRVELTSQDHEAIRALAKCDMNISLTARMLDVRRSTLEYRFERIRDITGLNPVRFYELHKLLNLLNLSEMEDDNNG